MAALPLLLVLVLAAAAAAGIALVRHSPPSRETTVAAARRHASVSAATALVLAGTAAAGTLVVVNAFPGVLPTPGRNGVGVLLAVFAFGTAHTTVLLLGELTWPRPDGDVRRARLVRRGLLDAAPRWLLRLALAAFLVGSAVIVLGALLAGPDGRSFGMTSPDGRVGGAASPFAGLAYGGPAAVGLAVLAALTVGALRVVAQRPAVVTADDRHEAALRRASAHRVLRGAAATVLVVAGGLLAVSGNAVRSASSGLASTATANDVAAGTAAAVLPWVGGVLAALGLVGALAGIGVLAVRAPGVPADEPVPAVA
ncbi:hypothetical protein [Blastococcus sp. TF02A-35]|uniref:hypothetical protein n=1 Tax=Blastococcus sp. TF02A-35 TaxID=2559612 RepID=UPI001ADDA6CB|nr:hypothetical protein [Blastococcus sp. TF02A_35]